LIVSLFILIILFHFISREQIPDQARHHLSPNSLLVVNGTEVKLKDVNPTQAVKQFHEKPHETHKFSHERPHPNKQSHINQPRRFNAFNLHEKHADQKP